MPAGLTQQQQHQQQQEGWLLLVLVQQAGMQLAAAQATAHLQVTSLWHMTAQRQQVLHQVQRILTPRRV
jgi:hypothetical protein